MARDTSSRLARLKQTFGLSEDESDLLEACAAVALDPALSRVCAYLQDRVARSYMTEDLAAALYGYGRCSVWTRESGLYRWELISSCDSGPGERGLEHEHGLLVPSAVLSAVRPLSGATRG